MRQRRRRTSRAMDEDRLSAFAIIENGKIEVDCVVSQQVSEENERQWGQSGPRQGAGLSKEDKDETGKGMAKGGEGESTNRNQRSQDGQPLKLDITSYVPFRPAKEARKSGTDYREAKLRHLAGTLFNELPYWESTFSFRLENMRPCVAQASHKHKGCYGDGTTKMPVDRQVGKGSGPIFPLNQFTSSS
ncbi:hypothetical protein SODALDRAFT_364153 [Sodiomyces alkalinus F11]|uniref:Uncharacterized protein n=1 Tax=Sodiomyces alkalinus (strain CBS 110278 / VKM F-3762 / F11) TaxID=1314773 RepID=A0A3N2PJE3_SODAK|nr:hypothetical protein SODALDRAFT_364153 [Sodiomyces alkalinus F11]ROT34651.1 hypothetical protein SODALDRAFT_364153 [Sodiomyces alkalinus F11]